MTCGSCPLARESAVFPGRGLYYCDFLERWRRGDDDCAATIEALQEMRDRLTRAIELREAAANGNA